MTSMAVRNWRIEIRALVVASGLAAMALGGCSTQKEYDDLFETNRSLTNSNSVLQRERDEARSQLKLTQDQLARAESGLNDLRRQNAELLKRLEEAGVSLTDLEKRLGNLSFGPLDPDTDALLRELAEKYPNLIQYDAARGMLRFASDLTFDSGDDTVKSSAKESLGALAEILKNPVAAPYDVIIVGHTDSQRISANTAKRHATNVHLSVHRSISVRRELQNMGAEPGKMQVAGWGEFRPLVENSGSGNTPQNRRVEIFFTRLRQDAAVPGVRSPEPLREATPRGERPPARPPEVTK
jgi:chemotaxis protein MotB